MAGIVNSVMSFIGMSDVQEDDDFVDSKEQATSFDSDRAVAPGVSAGSSHNAAGDAHVATINKMSRITTIHPKSYDDAQLVGRALRDGTPVVLNLTGVTESVAYRIVDFSAGVVFGVRGSIERVTPRVFLLSPAQVNINVQDAPVPSSSHDLFTS